jgi:hypothetical protein
MNISKHITYREAIRSITALRKGIINEPNSMQLINMQLVANKVFEPLRTYIGAPIKVESFFRCKKLNTAIGGSWNSQHMKGQAIDIDDDFAKGRYDNAKMFYFIAENLKFDQLIWEFGNNNSPGWIHVSYKESNNRNKISIAYKVKGRTYYKHFYNLEDFVIFKENLYTN